MGFRAERNLHVVEGGVGAGKTTIANALLGTEGLGTAETRLNANEWVVVREPGGTRFGEMVREAVQGDHDTEVSPMAALFAYSAARVNLVKHMVLPALEEGMNVLMDRYWFSTFAHQGAEGVSKPLIMAVSLLATGGMLPGKVAHLDLLPEVGMKRKYSNCVGLDRYDVKDLAFHEKVRSNYHQLGRIYRGLGKVIAVEWRVVDAEQDLRDVVGEVYDYFAG